MILDKNKIESAIKEIFGTKSIVVNLANIKKW